MALLGRSFKSDLSTYYNSRKVCLLLEFATILRAQSETEPGIHAGGVGQLSGNIVQQANWPALGEPVEPFERAVVSGLLLSQEWSVRREPD